MHKDLITTSKIYRTLQGVNNSEINLKEKAYVLDVKIL